jgi:hypothetical protein
MVVHRNGQSFFGVLLADAIKVQVPFDNRGFGDSELGLTLLILDLKFTVKDVFAKDDAVVADVNARPGNELAHFRLRFAAEAAHRDVGRTGQGEFMIYDLRLPISLEFNLPTGIIPTRHAEVESLQWKNLLTTDGHR